MKVVKKFVSYIAKQGVFPDNMKIGKVIPLYKAGDRNVFSNYRLISLLSQFSKILEKLFNERLDKFIDKCNLIKLLSRWFYKQNVYHTFGLTTDRWSGV